MRYVVMECHTSYAVVLAEDGRFLNVANMHYEVGQTVNDVFEMLPPAKIKHKGRVIFGMILAAICLVGLLAGVVYYLRLPYASVYMSVNPSVRIDVNKNNEVMDIEAMNGDGKVLIAGYSYDDKHLDLVAEELISMALQMGYIDYGDEIRFTFDAEDEWEVYAGQMLRHSIENVLGDQMSVTVRIDDEDHDYDDDYDDNDDDDDDFDD